MFKTDFINEFVEQASKLMPGANTREEINKSFNVVAQATLAKLDLVTREEFDAQVAVLQGTRQRIEELEAQLKVLSALVDAQQD